MGKLTSDDVKKVAALAKINLSEKEVEKFRDQLSSVVSFVEELNEVDTGDTKETSQTTGLKNVTRTDAAKGEPHLTQEEALSGGSNVHNGYFVVDRLVDNE